MEKILTWDITKECNLRCGHCYNAERYFLSNSSYLKKYISKDDLEEVCKFVKNNEITRVHLLGGEPTLHPEIIEIIQKLKDAKTTVTMATNAQYCDIIFVDNLIKSGVDAVVVSIDGLGSESNDQVRGRGSFEKAIKFLENFNLVEGDKPLLGIGLTITKLNVHELCALPLFCSKYGISSISLAYLSFEGNAKENWSNIEVSFDEISHAFVELINEWKKYSDSIALNIDTRQQLAKYLTLMTGVSFSSQVSPGCKGAKQLYYLDMNAQLSPCSPSGTSMRDNINSSVSSKLETHIDIKNLKGSFIGESFLSFRKFVESREVYEHIVSCINCEFECLPCPLLMGNKNKIRECDYAKEKIENIFKEMESMNYIIKNNLEDMITDECINEMGIRIINGILKKEGILNIINSICLEYGEKYDKVRNDVLVFIKNLEHEGGLLGEFV